MVLYFSHLCAGFIVSVFFYTFFIPHVLFMAASIAIALLVTGPDLWIFQPVMGFLGLVLGMSLVASLRTPRIISWCLIFSDSIYFFVALIEFVFWELVLFAAETIANPWGALLCALLWIILGVVSYEIARFYLGKNTEYLGASPSVFQDAAIEVGLNPGVKYIHNNKLYASVLYFWICFTLVIPLAAVWALVLFFGLWEFYAALIALASCVVVLFYTFMCLRAPVKHVCVSQPDMYTL